jgi:hypothetical protein
MNTLRLALIGGLVAAAPLFADGTASTGHSHGAQEARKKAAPAKLVQVVREATRPFLDINVATGLYYEPLFGCVSGPQQGAMGQHYVHLGLVGDGRLDATKPEALIYEFKDGRARLVGVEFIVDAATWLKDNDGPPKLEGQAFHLVDSPNRYALPAFFELHVWAWRDNPDGAFVDWNTRVSCEGQ